MRTKPKPQKSHFMSSQEKKGSKKTFIGCSSLVSKTSPVHSSTPILVSLQGVGVGVPLMAVSHQLPHKSIPRHRHLLPFAAPQGTFIVLLFLLLHNIHIFFVGFVEYHLNQVEKTLKKIPRKSSWSKP